MESLIILIHVIAAIAITGLVLIQQGKGADMGASFGSGASQTIFGSGGSGNALTKFTSIFAAVFLITSLSLAVIARQKANFSVEDSALIENMDQISTEVQLQDQEIPVAPDVPQAAAPEGDIPVLGSDDIPVGEE